MCGLCDTFFLEQCCIISHFSNVSFVLCGLCQMISLISAAQDSNWILSSWYVHRVMCDIIWLICTAQEIELQAVLLDRCAVILLIEAAHKFFISAYKDIKQKDTSDSSRQVGGWRKKDNVIVAWLRTTRVWTDKTDLLCCLWCRDCGACTQLWDPTTQIYQKCVLIQ